ncbi:MAG: outer membrane lipoprotein-sorting protein [Acidobacteria bacterium]|nr:outer membrane lipoprotein-sorting protein [Acidobacteriota bacterium]
MTRNSPSILILTCTLICAVNIACNRNPNKISKTAPTVTPETPLPDIASMIKRMTTQDGCRNFIAEMRLTVEDNQRKEEPVDFRIIRKYTDGGAMTFLTVTAPNKETDKAFLAIEQKGQPTQALTYLSGLKKLSRLNSAKLLGIGAARVSVQELLGMELNQYSYTPGERVAENDEQLIKVEFKEDPPLGLAYPRIIGFFREKDQQPARFELYDERDELQKRVTIEKIKPVEGHQTITGLAIDDLAHERTFKLETRKIEYDRVLADRIFTENHLKTFVDDASRRLDQNN